MEAFETFEHAGLTVELHYDEVAGNPFEDMDQAAELVWLDREQAYKNVGGKVSVDYDHFLEPDRLVSVAHGARYLTLMRGYLVALPFTYTDYGSGGVRASLVDPSYDRAAGYVCVHPRGVALTGCPDPEEAARQDFETWRAWVQGETYGFVVKDPDGKVLESCWGYYGEVDYMRGDARLSAETEAKDLLDNPERKPIHVELTQKQATALLVAARHEGLAGWPGADDPYLESGSAMIALSLAEREQKDAATLATIREALAGKEGMPV